MSDIDAPGPGEVTRLLSAWANGSEAAFDRLLTVVYAQLQSLAARELRKERAGHTFSSNDLVHEACLRLLGGPPMKLVDRRHFFGVAARAMRQVLVDHARARAADKRGGGATRVALEEATIAVNGPGVDLIDLDGALTRLSELDPPMARVVELRFFAGLSIEETAEAAGISPATVKREWKSAKAWLFRELGGAAGGPAGVRP